MLKNKSFGKKDLRKGFEGLGAVALRHDTLLGTENGQVLTRSIYYCTTLGVSGQSFASAFMTPRRSFPARSRTRSASSIWASSVVLESKVSISSSTINLARVSPSPDF